MNTRDADFLPAITKLIAERAGYRCSYPGCDESTVGPGAGPTDVERKGVAAHIFSSSTGGRAPRGTGGLSAEQRSRATNGIWMCQDHSRLIDTEKGKNYAAAELQAWKALHEMRIAREVQKVSIGNGHWLEKITLETNPLFKKGTSLILGKVTLILGDNGLGKSAFCEWISGASGNGFDLLRWSKLSAKSEIWLRMSLIVPERVEFSMKFDHYAMFCEYGGRQTLDLSHWTRVIYQTDRLIRKKFEDDFEYLARVWRIDQFQVTTVIDQISSSKYGFIEEAKFLPEEQDEESEKVPADIRDLRRGRPPLVLWAKISGHKHLICFEGLSGSEQGQFIVSGAMVIANCYSNNQGALLLLDLGSNFDDALLSAYAERLQSSDFNFQTILVAHSNRPKVNWTGWSIARLEGELPEVTIEQETVGIE